MKYYCCECNKRELAASAVLAAASLELLPICERCARSQENTAAGLPLDKHIQRIVSTLSRERQEYAAAFGFESFTALVASKRAAFDKLKVAAAPVLQSSAEFFAGGYDESVLVGYDMGNGCTRWVRM